MLDTTKLTERELDAALARHFSPPRRHVAHLREPYRDTMPVAPAPAEAATHIGADDDNVGRVPRAPEGAAIATVLVLVILFGSLAAVHFIVRWWLA